MENAYTQSHTHTHTHCTYAHHTSEAPDLIDALQRAIHSFDHSDQKALVAGASTAVPSHINITHTHTHTQIHKNVFVDVSQCTKLTNVALTNVANVALGALLVSYITHRGTNTDTNNQRYLH